MGDPPFPNNRGQPRKGLLDTSVGLRSSHQCGSFRVVQSRHPGAGKVGSELLNLSETFSLKAVGELSQSGDIQLPIDGIGTQNRHSGHLTLRVLPFLGVALAEC